MLLRIGRAKPSARAVASRSMGKPVPARAAAPSGHSSARARALAKRLFGTPVDAIITAICAALLVWAAIPLLRWAVLDATFAGTTRNDCTGTGACWVFIRARFGQFMYGFYPVDQRWRVDLAGAVLVAVSALLVPGVRRRVLLGAGTALAGVVAVALFTPVLAPYQRDRLLAFVDPTADPSGIGYQVAQVKTAIGSGGLFGQGLFEGRSTQGGFIPFQYTDFVFSVAGEELGFVGAVGVVALELFVVVRMLHVARRSEDDFARLVCVALAGWFVVQTLENLGMNLGLMPVTGVPLPFVSYGGSSMFSCWAAIGLVGNVHAASRRRIS